MTKEYDALIDLGMRGLAHDQFWCIIDPDGDCIPGTESKRFDEPVITFCNALKCDWDDATEEGYRLGQTTLTDIAGAAEEPIQL